ncbi:hypothetical protein JW906_16245 [bacterium]|nr:hypothetical protein [bacterium]
MKKQVLSAFVAVFLLGLAFHQDSRAYERSLVNLLTPTQLDARHLEFSIQHHFLGPVSEDPLENLLGVHWGANIGLSLRAVPVKRLDVWGSHLILNMEKVYGLGAGYTVAVPNPGFSMKFAAEWFHAKRKFSKDEWQSNLLFVAGLQTRPLFRKWSVLLNAGFDTDAEKMGAGIGLLWQWSKSLSLWSEYYPVRLYEDLDHDSYALGLKAVTYGHHFFLFVSNNTAPGVFRMMAGSGSGDLYLGFKIQRDFEW